MRIEYSMRLLLAIFLTPLISFSQHGQFQVRWGETFKSNKRTQVAGFVGKHKGNTYVLRYGKGDVNIDILDDKLNFVSNTKINLDYGKKNMRFEGIYQVDDSLVVLSSFSNLVQKVNYLFSHKLSLDDLDKKSSLSKIAEIPFERKNKDGYFAYKLSDDSSKCMIYYSLPFINGGPEKFGFRILDKSMATLWSKDISLPFENELFSIEKFIVSNNGDVFLSGVESKTVKKKSKRLGAANYQYHILSYTDNGEKIKDYKIDLDEKFITDLQFAVDNQHNLRCGGFYSENGTFSIRGTFYITIDSKNSEIITKSFREFDEGFITLNWKERDISKAKKKQAKKGTGIELYEYDLRNFIISPNGGIVLLAEQYYVQAVTTTSYSSRDMMSTRTTYHYYYNDIIAVSINQTGQIEWNTKIKKQQHSVDDNGYFSSFVTAIVDDNIYLVYNEDARDFHSKEDLSTMTRKEKGQTYTILTSINENGAFSKSILYNTAKYGVRTRPKVSEQIGETSLLLYNKWYRNQRFNLVDFGS